MSGKFFTFPLCLLSFSTQEKHRLKVICSHSIYRAGSNADVDEDQLLEYANKHGLSLKCEDDNIIVRGAMLCGVSIGSIKNTLDDHRSAIEHINYHAIRYGNDAIVSIGAELLWECYKDSGITYREFSTVCAINSILGLNREIKIVRRPLIQARQLGYKTPEILEAERRKDRSLQPLTTQQLKDTLNNLEERGFFTRCQANRRDVYFSTVLTGDKLRAEVKKREDVRKQIRNRRNEDRLFMSSKQA